MGCCESAVYSSTTDAGSPTEDRRSRKGGTRASFDDVRIASWKQRGAPRDPDSPNQHPHPNRRSADSSGSVGAAGSSLAGRSSVAAAMGTPALRGAAGPSSLRVHSPHLFGQGQEQDLEQEVQGMGSSPARKLHTRLQAQHSLVAMASRGAP